MTGEVIPLNLRCPLRMESEYSEWSLAVQSLGMRPSGDGRVNLRTLGAVSSRAVRASRPTCDPRVGRLDPLGVARVL